MHFIENKLNKNTVFHFIVHRLLVVKLTEKYVF